MRRLWVTRKLNCPFSATVALIEAFQRETKLKVGPAPFVQSRVESEMAEVRDYTDQVRIHEALILQWRSHGRFPVPRFRGMITARPSGPNTEIRIEGHYSPPLGKAGGVFDALAGRHIAQRTLERLADKIANYVDTKRSIVSV